MRFECNLLMWLDATLAHNNTIYLWQKKRNCKWEFEMWPNTIIWAMSTECGRDVLVHGPGILWNYIATISTGGNSFCIRTSSRLPKMFFLWFSAERSQFYAIAFCYPKLPFNSLNGEYTREMEKGSQQTGWQQRMAWNDNNFSGEYQTFKFYRCGHFTQCFTFHHVHVHMQLESTFLLFYQIQILIAS